jgi:hypothetical protein
MQFLATSSCTLHFRVASLFSSMMLSFTWYYQQNAFMEEHGWCGRAVRILKNNTLAPDAKHCLPFLWLAVNKRSDMKHAVHRPVMKPRPLRHFVMVSCHDQSRSCVLMSKLDFVKFCINTSCSGSFLPSFLSFFISFPFPFVPLQRRGCLVAPLFLWIVLAPFAGD